MKFACPHCGQHLESDQTVSGQSVQCPSCQKEIVFAARPADAPAPATPAVADGQPAAGAATVTEKLQSLWGKSIREQSRPEGTIKEGAASTMRHTTSISARLNVRPQAVAEPGANPEPPPHYQILKLLGKGGMGMVYEARQTSVDRTIALKMIKQEAAQDKQERNAFLAEAVATADLDHPNIVPVYDLGANDQGVLFYAMKEVQGTPWSKAIKDKTLNENLEVLMRVADAVAFAHSKGIIHRDLKPENVMLGEYGEVLLMDWGMAAAVKPGAKAEQLSEDYAVGGTPAYMAPEMAYGEIEKIGPASDVYLLGAILFEIIAGKRPHAGGTVMACLQNAAENKIQETEVKGELMDIALKAMATEPQNRFAGVKEFQAQVRLYLRHAESIVLATQAGEELGRAKQAKQYMAYADAVSGYRQALKLWAKNKAAHKGLIEARLAYAGCAMEKDDLDLAASLLDSAEPSHREMARKVEMARKERAARKLRHKLFKTVAVGSAAVVIVILSVAFVWVRGEQKKTLAEKKRAEQALTEFKAEQARRQADRKSSAPALVRSAKQFAESGDMAAAETLVDTALEYDGSFAEAHLVRAILWIEKSEWAKAGAGSALYGATAANAVEARLLADYSSQAGREGEKASKGGLAPILVRHGMPNLAARYAQSMGELLPVFRERLEKVWPGLGKYLRDNKDGTLSFMSDSGAGRVIKDLTPFKGMPLTILDIRDGLGTGDLSPLKGMRLVFLNASVAPVRDLSPLTGMPLKTLNLYYTEVSDLSPLAGMPLEKLYLSETKVGDLRPLAGMPLTGLDVRDCKRVSDLSPLKGMPLTRLGLSQTRVTDLAPLRGMPLESLSLQDVTVVDLTPLRGMPLRGIILDRSTVTDLTPLEGMKLTSINFTPENITNGIEVLRPMKSMREIVVRGVPYPAAEFWKQYDAGEFNKPTGK